MQENKYTWVVEWAPETETIHIATVEQVLRWNLQLAERGKKAHAYFVPVGFFHDYDEASSFAEIIIEKYSCKKKKKHV